MALAIKRFDFEGLQDFSSPPPMQEFVSNDNVLLPEVEDAPPPPPSFSEAELQAAKKSAFEEGRASGIKEEAEKRDTEEHARQQHIEQAMTRLITATQSYESQFHAFKTAQTTELAALVRLLVQKIAGDVLADAPAQTLNSMIEDCLNILQSQPKVIASVHPSIRETIAEKLEQMAENHHLEIAIIVKADEALRPGEARLQWPDGQAERNLNEIWQQIDIIINQINFSQLAGASPAMASSENQPYDKGEQA